MNELLSPAGTIEAFYAAISNGADAIYLGLDKFNARAYANNFSIENLEELVKFAHLRNVKIFVTMNTIIYDYEIDEVYKTIDELARIKVDAIIVQDLAIINYITENYKSIEAHASTQMGIDDLEGAKLLKELGVTRVVFARETPLKTLQEVKNHLNIEIETFIHGALCVAYSGNCLMSSMIGDRSGNRGRCAGCCRQVYSLLDLKNNKVIKTGYLLSMKDLNVAPNFDNLRFVDSLKIEGRMKEPNYVASVTNYYRKLIDKDLVDKESINKVFNRTYTKGFINNESSVDITNIEKPNNNGFEIGKVVKVNKNNVWIRLFKEVNKGDQIRIDTPNLFEEISIPMTKIFDANFKECETNSKMIIVSTHKKVDVGAKVFKTKDIKFINEANRSLLSKEYKKLGICMFFTCKTNEKPLLKVTYKDFVAYETLDVKIEKALTQATSKESVLKQLSKLNDTPYYLENFEINIDEDLFIPLKLINELRRNAIENLNNQRLNSKVITKKPTKIIPQNVSLHDPILTVQVSNNEQYAVAKSLGIEHIYFKNIVRRNNEKYIEGFDEILVGGLGAIEHYKNSNVSLVSDYSFNITNAISCALISSLGVSRITLSQEINRENINKLISSYYEKYKTFPNLELIVYGRSTLMHSKYCPLKRLNMCGECKKTKFALKDKFASFPLTFNEDCTTNILNSKTLNLIDEIDTLKNINYFRLVFTNESKEETIRIIKAALNKLEGSKEKIFNPKTDTRGHFIKNPL